MGRVLAFLGVVMLALTLAGPARAQDDPSAWQDVITAQVEAFREHDAAAAFSYSAHSFQETFPSAEQFFRFIMSSGYAPILTSKGHSFGEYKQFRPDLVQQLVTFTGTNLKIYQSIYELTLEPEGWKVTAVQFVQAPGIGV